MLFFHVLTQWTYFFFPKEKKFWRKILKKNFPQKKQTFFLERIFFPRWIWLKEKRKKKFHINCFVSSFFVLLIVFNLRKKRFFFFFFKKISQCHIWNSRKKERIFSRFRHKKICLSHIWKFFPWKCFFFFFLTETPKKITS